MARPRDRPPDPYLGLLGPALRELRRRSSLTVRGAAAKAELTPIEVSQYERGERRPGLDNLARYLRGVGADLCALQALLDRKSEPLVARTGEETTEDWRQVRAAFEPALSDEAMESRVRSVPEGLGWDTRSPAMEEGSKIGDNAELKERELPVGAVSRSQGALDPLARIGRQMGWDAERLADEVRYARRQVREIVRLDPKHRLSKIRGASSRYQGPLFGALLLEEARRRMPAAPAEALDLAGAAVVSSENTRRDPADPATQCAALAVRGNARRALGRLREGEADLHRAWRLLHDKGLLDPALPAEVYSYLGSLRKDQGQLEEAARHLRRAGTLYDLLEQPEKAAKVLLKLSGVYYRAHAFEAAVATAEEAVRLLPPDAEGWLRAYAHYNLAQRLHARGELDRAEAELAEHRELLAAGGEQLAQLVPWLRARIAWSRDDFGAAERLYTEARRRALERGIAWDAGLVSLELALVHLVQGRTARVKTLAMEALRVFAEEDVEREVRAALDLLEAAAQRDALTRQLLEHAVAALERAHHAARPRGA